MFQRVIKNSKCGYWLAWLGGRLAKIKNFYQTTIASLGLALAKFFNANYMKLMNDRESDDTNSLPEAVLRF